MHDAEKVFYEHRKLMVSTLATAL